MSGTSLEDIILGLIAERGPGKTICPTEAAKASGAAPSEPGWGTRIKQVRAAAVGLARSGQAAIYRKGSAVDPDDFRGVYRIGLAKPAEE